MAAGPPAVVALAEASAAAGTPVAANTIRQDLRELLRAALALTACFPAVLPYVLRLLAARQLALALAATTCQDRLTASVLSVVARSRAIPVAWAVRPAAAQGACLPLLLALLGQLRPVVLSTPMKGIPLSSVGLR